MAPAAAVGSTPSVPSKGASSTVTWRPTKIMNMRDLSKDDDFLSHLLVEKLGTGAVPLLVHKMDSSRRLPKTDAGDLLNIVRRLVVTKGPVHAATRQAVDELLSLAPVRYYLKPYTQKQINAFATHASRYFELYHPSGSIEIAHTSRYSHRTGKSELCILATRQLNPGNVITELKGSMAHLTKEEDKELKRTDLRNTDIRRDFSVIHSRQMKKNHLFLGPARFVNHDCENNCELFREGKYITFRVIKAIAVGEEITAHYGDGYFGRKNRHCLCETCETKGRGGYAPDHSDTEDISGSESESNVGSESDSSSSDSESSEEELSGVKPQVNVNERRTRRGVYAIVQEEDDESDESDDEDATNSSRPLADAKDVPAEGDIELEAEAEVASELSSLSPSRSSSGPSSTSVHTVLASGLGLPTPDDSDPSPASSLSPLSISVERETSVQPKSVQSTHFKSIISTRRQKARESLGANDSVNNVQTSSKPSQRLITPPLSEDTASLPDITASSRKVTRSSLLSSPTKSMKESISRLPTPSQDKGKGKEQERPREEPEARILRARPSLPSGIPEPGPRLPTKLDVPRGPDGKPLPTCITCLNVLPVISVDSQVVWGLAFESNSPPKRGRKKKLKQECPRCLRHFAIYGQPWPCRVPGQGIVFAPTPREEATPVDPSSRRVTQKALPALDRKLTAAASAPAKIARQQTSHQERPAKKAKTNPLTKAETEARKALMSNGRTRSGRSSLPTVKLQTQEVDEPPVKRKRGRPRLSSPRRAAAAMVTDKIMRPKSLAVQFQPRDSNGRFGRKGDSKGENNPQVEGRSEYPYDDEGNSAREGRGSSLKLKTEDSEELEGHHFSASGSSSQKRKSIDDGDGDDSFYQSSDRRYDQGSSFKRPRLDSGRQSSGQRSSYPLPLGGFRKKHSLSLFPSPNHFAARHSLSVEQTPDVEESTRRQSKEVECDNEPVNEESAENISDGAEHPIRRLIRGDSVLFMAAGLKYNPSPFHLARRRWPSLRTPIADSHPHYGDEPQKMMPESRDSARDKATHSYVVETAKETAIDSAPVVIRTKASYPRHLIANVDPESSSSGEEDVILPESPDPSKFVLQRRASFGSSGAATAAATGSSENAIECLVAVSDTLSAHSSDGTPPNVSWKDKLHDPQQLRKSTPFSTDEADSPLGFRNADWEISSELSVESGF